MSIYISQHQAIQALGGRKEIPAEAKQNNPALCHQRKINIYIYINILFWQYEVDILATEKMCCCHYTAALVREAFALAVFTKKAGKKDPEKKTEALFPGAATLSTSIRC